MINAHVCHSCDSHLRTKYFLSYQSKCDIWREKKDLNLYLAIVETKFYTPHKGLLSVTLVEDITSPGMVGHMIYIVMIAGAFFSYASSFTLISWSVGHSITGWAEF